IPSWCAPPTSRIWWATPPSSARRRGGRPGCRWRTCWPRWWVPKRTDLETILIIGSGPIVIGQAAEFDYSGTQAIKALKEEGYKVVLVNSNPATIMTDPELADRTYIEPVTAEWVARVIEREHPDALLPTMGGQTALNVAMALAQDGTLAKYGVELIGADQRAIRMAEDRKEFALARQRIGLAVPPGRVVGSLEEAMEAVEETGYPAIIRPSFTLGGTGGGVAYNRAEYKERIARALDLSPVHAALVEQSVLGWKEFGAGGRRGGRGGGGGPPATGCWFSPPAKSAPRGARTGAPRSRPPPP